MKINSSGIWWRGVWHKFATSIFRL